ncbi:hypothetical protein ADUPG1_010632 [Aduncisulcus paluster]|uniref:Uncharacterized protein n=1 Tax=Aduncisulcus paluster TaxID=2918883 RepID=A0ABQ5JXH4_9EUKA|nr:hypothetical protein ADUPG1_010632 [Aduncisulcus paluster]
MRAALKFYSRQFDTLTREKEEIELMLEEKLGGEREKWANIMSFIKVLEELLAKKKELGETQPKLELQDEIAKGKQSLAFLKEERKRKTAILHQRSMDTIENEVSNTLDDFPGKSESDISFKEKRHSKIKEFIKFFKIHLSHLLQTESINEKAQEFLSLDPVKRVFLQGEEKEEEEKEEEEKEEEEKEEEEKEEEKDQEDPIDHYDEVNLDAQILRFFYFVKNANCDKELKDKLSGKSYEPWVIYFYDMMKYICNIILGEDLGEISINFVLNSIQRYYHNVMERERDQRKKTRMMDLEETFSKYQSQKHQLSIIDNIEKEKEKLRIHARRVRNLAQKSDGMGVQTYNIGCEDSHYNQLQYSHMRSIADCYFISAHKKKLNLQRRMLGRIIRHEGRKASCLEDYRKHIASGDDYGDGESSSSEEIRSYRISNDSKSEDTPSPSSSWSFSDKIDMEKDDKEIYIQHVPFPDINAEGKEGDDDHPPPKSIDDSNSDSDEFDEIKQPTDSSDPHPLKPVHYPKPIVTSGSFIVPILISTDEKPVSKEIKGDDDTSIGTLYDQICKPDPNDHSKICISLEDLMEVGSSRQKTKKKLMSYIVPLLIKAQSLKEGNPIVGELKLVEGKIIISRKKNYSDENHVSRSLLAAKDYAYADPKEIVHFIQLSINCPIRAKSSRDYDTEFQSVKEVLNDLQRGFYLECLDSIDLSGCYRNWGIREGSELCVVSDIFDAIMPDGTRSFPLITLRNVNLSDTVMYPEDLIKVMSKLQHPQRRLSHLDVSKNTALTRLSFRHIDEFQKSSTQGWDSIGEIQSLSMNGCALTDKTLPAIFELVKMWKIKRLELEDNPSLNFMMSGYNICDVLSGPLTSLSFERCEIVYAEIDTIFHQIANEYERNHRTFKMKSMKFPKRLDPKVVKTCIKACKCHSVCVTGDLSQAEEVKDIDYIDSEMNIFDITFSNVVLSIEFVKAFIERRYHIRKVTFYECSRPLDVIALIDAIPEEWVTRQENMISITLNP